MPVKKLSPSRIKTLESCTLKYFYNYEYSAEGPKLPNLDNSGSFCGSIAHDVFEMLLVKDKYFTYVNNINRKKKLTPGLIRLIKRKIRKKIEFDTQINFDKCVNFILVGLNHDFWIEGGDLQPPEYKFDIQEETYSMIGFVDAHSIFKDKVGSYCVLRDYKSFKQKFSEEELNANIQGFTYLLAVKKKFPEIDLMRSRVEFIALAYPEDPVQTFRIKNETQINGFIKYLEYIQKRADSFNDRTKFELVAAKQEYPKKGEGFKGPLICGRGVTNFKERKKDNSDFKYHCAYRFPFDYYILVDELGKVRHTSFEPLQEKDGLKLEKHHFNGCSYFNRPVRQIPVSEVVEDFDF